MRLYEAVQRRTLASVPTTMTVSEARAALPQLLDRVGVGEEVTITRHGRAAAVMVHPDTLRVRRAGDALARATEVGDLLDRSRRSPLRTRPTLSEEHAEALAAEVQAGRDRR